MTKFEKPIKIYLFKDTQTVSVSFMVTERLVNQYTLTVDEFEKIIKPNGFYSYTEFQNVADNAFWYVESKEYGPKPDKKYGPYVRVSVSTNGMTSHYRFSLQEWNNMIDEYREQQNSKMYWDM